MRWAEHAACMGVRGEGYTGFWRGNLREINHLEDLGVDGRIILILILQKSVGRVWIGSIWRALVNAIMTGST
jgi:hypothetical protein